MLVAAGKQKIVMMITAFILAVGSIMLQNKSFRSFRYKSMDSEDSNNQRILLISDPKTVEQKSHEVQNPATSTVALSPSKSPTNEKSKAEIPLLSYDVSNTTATEQYCDERLEPLLMSSNMADYDPGEVNRIRRALASDNPSCYESHFGTFANHFKTRMHSVKNHLSLHIPKAGGTSLCSLANKSSKQTTQRNCWERAHFCPLWCCCKFADHQEWPSCSVLDESLPEFVMNENYLDYPLCMQNRIYSMLLRDPIDRAMSHVRHLSLFNERLNGTLANYTARMSLVQNNYMTWALASRGATSRGDSERILLIPQSKHLEVAMDTLSRIDFVMELSQNTTCDVSILKFMGFEKAGLQHKNVSKRKKETIILDRESYELTNALDMKLFHYARDLMKLDCEFFVRLEKEDEVEKYF